MHRCCLNNDIPVNTACNRYNTGATNMNANSIGSVTPVKKLANAAAPMIEATLAFCAGLAVWTNANAPPNKPNIIIGKNPA